MASARTSRISSSWNQAGRHWGCRGCPTVRSGCGSASELTGGAGRPEALSHPTRPRPLRGFPSASKPQPGTMAGSVFALCLEGEVDDGAVPHRGRVFLENLESMAAHDGPHLLRRIIGKARTPSHYLVLVGIVDDGVSAGL